GDQPLRIAEEDIERTLVPDDSRARERAAIAEIIARASLAADNADERRPELGACRSNLVARRADLVQRLPAGGVLRGRVMRQEECAGRGRDTNDPGHRSNPQSTRGR